MCDAAWYKEFLDLNPREQARRDLVVGYAESQPNLTTEYFRRLFPRYWFDSDSIPPGMAGTSLGLSVPQENRLITDMSKVVIPAFQSAPEYRLSADLRFPSTTTSSGGRADGVSGGTR